MTGKEFLKKFGLASLGAAVVTKQKLAQVAHHLVAEGEKNKVQVVNLERKLKAVAKQAKAKASAGLDAVVAKALRKSGAPTKAEFNALKRRLAQLEKRAVIAK